METVTLQKKRRKNNLKRKNYLQRRRKKEKYRELKEKTNQKVEDYLKDRLIDTQNDYIMWLDKYIKEHSNNMDTQNDYIMWLDRFIREHV